MLLPVAGRHLDESVRGFGVIGRGKRGVEGLIEMDSGRAGIRVVVFRNSQPSSRGTLVLPRVRVDAHLSESTTSLYQISWSLSADMCIKWDAIGEGR